MRKFLPAVLSIILLFSVVSPTLAKVKETTDQIPEVSGDYKVPNHDNLRVRVFVHGPKDVPQQTVNEALICNLPDPDSTAVVPKTGWHLPSTWSYRLNRSSVPSSVGSTNIITIAANSFNQWSTAVGGKVVFSRGSDTSVNRARYDGQNIIAWGRTSSSTLAVAYTWYYPSTGLVAEEDIIFNKGVPWSWSGNNGGCANTASYDAQNILTHEAGHWMGLDDTYDAAYTENTLFGYGSKGEIKKNTLTTGDILGVNAIYP